jgi:hypothetical protein
MDGKRTIAVKAQKGARKIDKRRPSHVLLARLDGRGDRFRGAENQSQDGMKSAADPALEME